jgi:endo-1,4-beta-D-glucanase Y
MWKASAWAFAFLLSVSLARADAPKHPFPAARVAFAAGALHPSMPQAAIDEATAAFYDRWKARYLIDGCGPEQKRIRMEAGNIRSVSEGQGYGMVIVALMAGHDPQAQPIFDQLFRYARRHRSDFDRALMSWAQNEHCQDIEGRDSAADGDLDIAYALLLADAQWGSAGAIDYRKAAVETLAAIIRHTMDEATGLTLLGDWVTPDGDYAHATRTSDWMIDHFRAFAAIDPGTWNRAVDAHLDLALKLQEEFAPKTGLLPDFVADTAEAPKPAPPHFLEAETDGAYAWNACRTPWRLGTDALLSGDRRAVAAVRRMSAWIHDATGGDPTRIGESYRLDGAVIDPAESMAYVAPFAVAAMSGDRDWPWAQTWLDRLWAEVVATPPDGYYSDSIKLQAMLTIGGHWWSPTGSGPP